jgi:hypothetical protein
MARFDNPIGVKNSKFGATLALSGDGNTALIYGANNSQQCEVVYAYDRVQGEWMTTPSHVFLPPIPAVPPADCEGDFEFRIALSADGSTVVISAPYEATKAAYVYARVDHVWSSQPVAMFYAPDGTGDRCFGCTVAVSADGTTTLVAAPAPSSSESGEAFLYRRKGGVWPTSPTATLIEPHPSGDNIFDYASLSANGDKALIADFNIDNQSGRTYLYSANSGAWAPKPKPMASFPYGGNIWLAPDAATVMIAEYQSVGLPHPIVELYTYQGANGGWSESNTVTFYKPVSGNLGDNASFAGNGKTLLIAGAKDLGREEHLPFCCGEVYVYTLRHGVWDTTPVVTLKEPNAPSSPYNVFFGATLAMSRGGSTALVGDPQSGGSISSLASGGPGVAFAFTTTTGWQEQETPPPPPRTSPTKSNSGGGAFGWLTLITLIAFFGLPTTRRRFLLLARAGKSASANRSETV